MLQPRVRPGQGANDRVVGADRVRILRQTEGIGFTACDGAEWLAHKGTVGRVLFGDLHILDEAMNPVSAGTIGTVWFRLGSPFEYFNDKARTAE
jgi:long-chain acyl-CoA synthetase